MIGWTPAHVEWSEVTGLCGFRGWQLRKRKVLGWHDPGLRRNTWLGPNLQKKCGLVTGRNSLDAELGSCGMLMENSRPWLDKSVCQQRTLLLLWMCLSSKIAFFAEMVCTQVDCYRASPLPASWSVGGTRLGCARLCGLGLFVGRGSGQKCVTRHRP